MSNRWKLVKNYSTHERTLDRCGCGHHVFMERGQIIYRVLCTNCKTSAWVSGHKLPYDLMIKWNLKIRKQRI